MRRKYFGLAIAAIATLGPMQAFGGDREIAEQIIQRLKANRDSGALEDFALDLKVDQGVVVFRGNVSGQDQKDLVLNSAGNIDGIAQIVDEVRVEMAAEKAQATKAPAEAVKPVVAVAEVVEQTQELKPVRVSVDDDFSLRSALAQEPTAVKTSPVVVPGEVRMTSAVELAAPPRGDGDQQLVADVVTALGRAKDAGKLKGFGVDVKSKKGIVQLRGRAASVAQRDAIVDITRRIAGVVEIREAISVPSDSPNLAALPKPPALQDKKTPAMAASTRTASNRTVPTQTAPAPRAAAPAAYRGPHGTGVPARAVQYSGGVTGAPVMGQPVPMAPYSGVAGAPRYDSPQLPNYAWPGYASHPNYAALTYPQQYSPSAWPYIGPFYPYPQVPLGWRKVSLEWDDGWWFLDFTDR